MHIEITRKAEGKRVVTATGEPLGVVERVDGGRAYVRPKPGLVDGLGSWLTGCVDGDDLFALDDSVVVRIDGSDLVLAATSIEQPPSRR